MDRHGRRHDVAERCTTGSRSRATRNFTTIVAAGVHQRALLGAARSRWSTRARSTTGRSSRRRRRTGSFDRRRRQTQRRLHETRRASSTRRCRRRRSRRSAGRPPPGAVVFQWTPVPEQVKNYTIEVAQDDSFSTILESATTDATAYAATHDLSRSARRSTGACAPTTTTARASRGRARRRSCRRCPRRRSRRPRRSRAPRSRRSRWTPVDGATSYEVQDVWPDGSVHVTSNIPSTAVSYTKMTGIGHGTVQVRAVFDERLQERLHADARRRPHDRRAGRHEDAADQQARQARADVRLEHEDQRQAVQGAGLAACRASSRPFLDETTDQSSYTPLLTAAGLHRRRHHVLARRRGRPRRQRGRVLARPRSSRSWRACRCRSRASRRKGSAGVGDRHRPERQGQADQGRRRQAPAAPA